MSRSIQIEASKLPEEGDSARVSLDEYDIAIFNVDGELCAIDNECPHHGASLADGWVQDGVVSCPWHCWQFETSTGQCLSVEGNDVRTYPIRIEDGTAHIDVEAC